MNISDRLTDLMMVLFRTYTLWFFWLVPKSGWKDRYKKYKAGQTSWPMPNRPDGTPRNPILPWPVEWLVAETHPAQLNSEKGLKYGLEFVATRCAESGEHLPPGVGVRCLRCGVPLHPSRAGMVAATDPPGCRRCRVLIRWFGSGL